MAATQNSMRTCLNNPSNLVDPVGTDWVHTTASFSAGLGDALLLRLGGPLRRWAGADDLVDPCSTAYSAGGWTRFCVGVTRIGYAAAGKGISVVAASGAAASAGRQQLKNVFRLGIGKSWR